MPFVLLTNLVNSEIVLNLDFQPAQTRLQILLAKLHLSPVEIEDANALLANIGDWHAMSQASIRNFSLPLTRRNLMRLDHSVVPKPVWDAIQNAANATALRNMRIVGAQKRFLTDCLTPLGIQGVFFKGINLAAQYYPDVGLRPCRDIDVLVPKGTLRTVINQALAQGYLLIAPDINARPMSSERDINAVLRYGKSATLISADGMMIDLQDYLDKSSGIFDNYDVFSDHDTVQIAGASFSTMKPAFLFNYLCHHHARHTWSHLYWLSDIDAMISSKTFDKTEVLALADQLGQTGTVEASLELHRLMSSQTPWDNGPDLARGKAFLQLCIANLPGGLATEKRVGLKLIGGEFMFPWQARPALMAKARRRWWSTIFRPTILQYSKTPLPEMLQWLYYFPRFFTLVYQVYVRLRLGAKYDQVG